MKLYKYYSKVTSKGQITIPTNIRNNLDIPVGSKIELIQKDNYIIIMPINGSLTKLKGFLPKPKLSLTTEEMDQIIRKHK